MDLSLSFTLSFYLEKRFYEMKVANAGLSPDGFSHFPRSTSPCLFFFRPPPFCLTPIPELFAPPTPPIIRNLRGHNEVYFFPEKERRL